MLVKLWQSLLRRVLQLPSIAEEHATTALPIANSEPEPGSCWVQRGATNTNNNNNNQTSMTKERTRTVVGPKTAPAKAHRRRASKTKAATTTTARVITRRITRSTAVRRLRSSTATTTLLSVVPVHVVPSKRLPVRRGPKHIVVVRSGSCTATATATGKANKSTTATTHCKPQTRQECERASERDQASRTANDRAPSCPKSSRINNDYHQRSLVDQPPRVVRRRQRGSVGAMEELAQHIVQCRRVLFITGAGLSVASGIRPFRSHPHATTTASAAAQQQFSTTNNNNTQHQQHQQQHSSTRNVLCEGLWNEVVWTMATRDSFRRDPVHFYNEFWIPHFMSSSSRDARPNAGHEALQTLLDRYPTTVHQVTQNIDGLQKPRPQQLVEVHGRVGLYKCCPAEDSDDDDNDTDNSDDDDDCDHHNKDMDIDDDMDEADRPVQLGDRRKSRRMRKSVIPACPYQFFKSLTVDQLILRGSDKLRARGPRLTVPPRCPACGNPVMPQSLLFDEGYHAHSFYQFETVEAWLAQAEVLVFVGTSWGAVRLTRVALERAREQHLPCYNFNTWDTLESTARLDAANIMGDATDTLPQLVAACQRLAAVAAAG